MDPTSISVDEVKNGTTHSPTASAPPPYPSALYPMVVPPLHMYEMAPSSLPMAAPVYPPPPAGGPHIIWMPQNAPVAVGQHILAQTSHIRDYLAWSVLNVFLGCMAGVIAVIFSFQTRKRKQVGDIQGALRMSKITLIVNILITILFFISTAFIIVYYFYVMSFLKAN